MKGNATVELSRRVTRQELVQLYSNERMSLNTIGKLYGVTRERVRQWMERENLSRRRRGWNSIHSKKKFSSATEYFEYVKNTGKESYSYLRLLVHSIKNRCDECGARKNLQQHHLKYPAKSFDDVQLLCASCHMARHRNGNGRLQQIRLCNDYLNGASIQELNDKYQTGRGNTYYFLHKWGIGLRYRREKNKPIVEQLAICQDYIAGKLIREIMAKHHTHICSIYYFLRKQKIVPNRREF